MAVAEASRDCPLIRYISISSNAVTFVPEGKNTAGVSYISYDTPKLYEWRKISVMVGC